MQSLRQRLKVLIKNKKTSGRCPDLQTFLKKSLTKNFIFDERKIKERLTSMIGYFADLIFETSDKKIITFNEMTREATAVYEDHACIGQKPQSEFLHPDLDTVSMNIILHTKLNIDPKTEADKWLDYCRRGVVGTLCVGVPIGVDKWTIRSVSQQW